MTLTGGDDLNIEINGSTVCTDYDQFDVDGIVTLGGADLVLSFTYTPANGTTYTIIDNDGGDAVIGMFSQGTSMTSGCYTFNINYAGGSGNDVVLTVTGPVLNTTTNLAYCTIQDAINDPLTIDCLLYTSRCV